MTNVIDSQPSANTYNVDGLRDDTRAARIARAMFVGDTVVMGDQVDEPSHNALLRTLHQRGLGLAYSARSDDRLTETWRVVAIDHPEAI